MTRSDSQSPFVGVAQDVDVDRGFAFGALVGVGMAVVFQLALMGAFQFATSGEATFFGPLRLAGVTQLLYVVPTLLLFVNRRCPRQAGGYALVAGVVVVLSLVGLAVG